MSPLPLKISNVGDPPLFGYGAQCNQRERVQRRDGDQKTTHLIKLIFNYDKAVYIPVSLNNLSKSWRENTTYFPIRYSSGL